MKSLVEFGKGSDYNIYRYELTKDDGRTVTKQTTLQLSVQSRRIKESKTRSKRN